AQVGFFSAPGNASCLGVACGVEHMSDNVRSINLMAETISRFRDPLNTISVLDAKVLEPYQNAARLGFLVRLSTPAPAGGVRFDIATVGGGSASPGIDYVARTVTGQVIPEGERERLFEVAGLPDEGVEGDETLHARLSNISGMPVFDFEALGVIVDDDPRAKITGSLVFPEGQAGPSQLYVYAQPTLDGASEWLSSSVTAPDYRFEFAVKAGARVKLEAYMEESDPWLTAIADLGRIDGDSTRDLHIERAVRLTGRVRWPAGGQAPDGPIDVVAWNVLGDSY